MKRKHFFRWLVLAAVLLLLLWCLLPIRYSKDYAQRFQSVNEGSRQRLVELLLADYAQMVPYNTDDRLCYQVLYEDGAEGRLAVSVQRLWEDTATGKLMKAEVPMQVEMLDCLEAIDGFGGLLPTRVELIYVSPDRVRIGTHMCIREVFWQRKGLPLGYSRQLTEQCYALYWLGGDWYYDCSIAR